MHALVISGGGSKGAFAGGVAEYLITECNIDYDVFVGSSTGSLLLSHLAMGKIDKIKELFTSTTQKDIFNINPFYIKHTKNGTKVSINHFNTLRTFIMRRKTFGETKNLRKLLSDNISEQEYNQLKADNEEILVTVSNLTKSRTEFKSNLDHSYEDFMDWIWASANFVPFMSMVEKDGCEYADGGFGAHTPIQAAINHGATSVDVIVLETEEVDHTLSPADNAFVSLMNVFDYMTNQIYRNDLTIGNLKAKLNDVEVRFFHLPRVLTGFPLVFNPEEMKVWWKEGYEHAKKENPAPNIIRRA